ncbi:MAG: hypothetical protein AAF561_00160 [Planctomycetota bacterium]
MSGTFDEQSAKRIGNVVRRVERTPENRVGRDRPLPPPAASAVYRITSSTRDGSNWRWDYEGKRQRWNGGFDWTDVGDAVPMLNLVEQENGSSGVVSGIDLADDEVTGIEPIEGLVSAFAVFDSTGASTLVFEQSNTPIIDCEAGT